MRLLLSIVLLMFMSFNIHSQVDDLTPEGIWQDMFVTTFANTEAAFITGTALDNQKYYYLFTDTLIHLDPDTSFNGYNKFLSTEDLYYFLFIQTGICEFILVQNDTVKVLANPALVNWNSAGNPLIMSNQSLFWPLKDISSGKIHMVSVSEDGLEILDNTPYSDVGDFSTGPQGRHYTYVRDTLDVDRLVYFDLDSGYVKKNSPAYGNIVTIDNNPGDDLHSIIVNNSNATPSQIYKVNQGDFTPITIPAGPYDQINLLFRNQANQTSLFELLDFNGNRKLVKKVASQWTDLTNLVPSFSSVVTERAFAQEVFLEVVSIDFGSEFWSFQSYAGADTLINVTPDIDTFIYITELNIEQGFPFSVIFAGKHGKYLYNYFPELSPLIATPYELANPGDSAANHITYRRHNYFSFDYYNADSSSIYSQLFHRETQGSQLEHISILPDFLSFDLCINSSSAILHKDGIGALTNEYYYYNLDSLQEFELSLFDSADIRTHKRAENLCLLLSENRNVTGEQEFAYINSQAEDKGVDITHPRYKPSGSAREFKGHLLTPIENIQDENDARLWLLREDLKRFDENCNSDIKFLNSNQTDVTGMTKVAAKEIVIGGHISPYPGEGFELNYDSSVEFTPNAEIDQGAAMNIVSKDCNSSEK